MEDMERNKRKNQITFMVKLYFDKLDMDKSTLDEWTDKALNTFLDSELTVDEINDRLSDTFKNNKDSFDLEGKEDINVGDNSLDTEAMSEAINEGFKEDNAYDDIDVMFKDNEVNPTFEAEEGKVLVKSSEDHKDAGYIDNIVITTLALISFALCGIGLALLYLLK